MKVLLLMPLDHKYGAQHSLRIFLRECQRITSKVEFVVITGTYGSANDFCNRLGIENYVIKHEYAIYGLMKNRVLQELKRKYKQVRVGLGYESAVKNIEKKLDISSFDLIYAGINRDLLGILLARKYNKPLVMHLHEFCRGHFGHDVLYKNQIQLMNKYASSYIAISKVVSKEWQSVGLDASKITVVYNGMTPSETAYNYNAMDNHKDKLRLVMVGGMYEQKGQRQLIQAIGNLPKSSKELLLVDFIGDGQDKYLKMLQQLIDDSGLSDICRLKGYDPEIREKLENYDVGAVCSKAEGFGMVTVEYMMAGLCPVVSDTGANTEIVEDNRTGLVYRYGDANDLSEKIQYMIENPNKRREMAYKAKQEALERFNAECFSRGVLEVLFKNHR